MDRIITSVPVNRITAIGMAGGETMPVRDNDHTRKRWVAPPSCMSYKGNTDHDLTDKIFGQLQVIGFYSTGNSGGRKGPRWLVRCICGIYETRYFKSLLNGKHAGAKLCTECCYIEWLKGKGS